MLSFTGSYEDIAQEREANLYCSTWPQIHEIKEILFDASDVLCESYLGEVADEVTRQN